ncbi:hypothetical protein H9W95_13770 [Flavobacterium lindanitolerans]|nr:hypothetical protein [Flavobacterium lindanitolerans]
MDQLNESDERIVKIRKGNKAIINDTVFRKLIRDSLLIKEFRPQLKELKNKWVTTDSLLRANIDSLNNWKKGIVEKECWFQKTLSLLTND